MIPVKLTLKGLYSYKESQCIDFEELISSGLFGIFGAVGSGKSSILEAIMFVLFERSDRLNISRDNRYYNMLNLQSDEMILDFIFLAGLNNAQKFRFRFEARRSKKDFEKVERKERAIYQWLNNTWEPLSDIKDASAILGMSYENFMQTIIIPQGKFREFVDHSAGERTKMLKELFHLERFDLSDKTNKLISNNKQDIDHLEGRLAELGEIAQNFIDEKENDLKEKQDILEKEHLRCHAKKSEEKKLQIDQKLFNSIQELELRKSHLMAKSEYFASKEKLVNAYEKAFTFLNEKIKVRESLKADLQKADQKKETFTINFNQNENKLQQHREILSKAKEAYLNREKIKEKCDDLENIIHIKTLEEKIDNFKIKVQVEKAKHDETEKSLSEAKQLLQMKEKEQEELETHIPDISEAQEVYHWYKRKSELQNELDKHQNQLKIYFDNLEKIENEKRQNFSNGKSSLSFEEIESGLLNQYKKAEIDKAVVNKELQNLVVQQKFKDLTINLKDGEPCPLCGSLEHPAVADVHGVDNIIQNNENKLKEIEILQAKIRDEEHLIKKLHLDFKHQLSFIKEKEQEVHTYLEKFETHENSFTWNNYKEINEIQIRNRIKTAEANIGVVQRLKKETKNIREEISRKDAFLKDLNQKLNVLEMELNGEEAVKKSFKSQLKQLSIEKFENFSVVQLNESLRRGQIQYLDIENNYETAKNLQQQLESNRSTFQEQIIWADKEVLQLESRLKQMNEEIENTFLEKGFESLQQVQEILNAAINLEIERKLLDQYHKDFHATEIALQKSYEEANGFLYNEAYHNEIIQELELLENKIKVIQREVDIQEQEIKTLLEKTATKKIYEKELEKLKIRELNLKDLRKMFMGNGFVRYVSTIYLQDLCKAANHRFFKLTNNNLSLELNNEEEFIVRDYLNNGKTRLLKTLSGGQTFQAALCLALALAENVKSLNKAEKSFFFLDEGFGSLDKESLRVVFDTLKTLRNENRIVGIISHVEELQQEIDLYLRIVNDKEKGSQVQYSWNSYQ